MGWVCNFCSANNDDSNARCFVCEEERGTTSVCTLTAKRVIKLGLTGDVVVPFEYNVIGARAFLNRTDITSVSIHSGVRKIAKEAFSGCTNLKYVNAPKELDSVDDRAFFDCKALKKEFYPKARNVSKSAFDTIPVEKVSHLDVVLEEELSPSIETFTTSDVPSGMTPKKAFIYAILLGIFLAVITPVVISLTSAQGWYAWQWVIGIFGGVGLALGVFLISNIFIEPYFFDTLSSFFLMIINFVFLFIFKQDYIIISSCFCVMGMIGAILVLRISFKADKKALGVFDIALSVINAVALVASLILVC